jgi:hypothetical protein
MKGLFGVAVAMTLGLGAMASMPAIAQNCIYRCGSDQIRFTPGDGLRIEILNRTSSLVQVERVFDLDPLALRPGQTLRFDTRVAGEAELSIAFWDETYLPITVRLHRPETRVLQIELLPSGTFGDRAVHVLNDGRVMIY